MPPQIVNLPSIHYSSRNGAPILAIVIHATAGTDSRAWLQQNPSSVSAHCLIARNGTIYRMVDDAAAAHHCGYSRIVIGGKTYDQTTRPGPNAITLGVELENLNDGKQPYPEAQIAALGWLLSFWRTRFNSLPMFFHREIDQRGKTDPAGLSWDRVRAAVPQPPAQHQVIGVAPSISLARFLALLRARKAPLEPATLDTIGERIYTFAAWLDIDPAFWLALWSHEQGVPLGGSQIGQATRNPLNIKAYGRWPSISAKGAMWNVYSSWQIGYMASILHLKDIYGAAGLLHIETIIPVFAPATDNNNPASYIAAVLADMRAMQE